MQLVYTHIRIEYRSTCFFVEPIFVFKTIFDLLATRMKFSSGVHQISHVMTKIKNLSHQLVYRAQATYDN
jgi:hypothetical protein